MMNGPLGLGLVLRGSDQASPTISRVKRGLIELRQEANRSRDSMGRFSGGAAQSVAGVNRGLVQMHQAGMKARDEVSELFGDVRAFGLKMAAGGGLGLASGFGLAKANGELSDALAGLKVVASAGDAEMARFKNVALDMGMTSQFTAAQVANSLTDIASAGYNAKDSIDLLRPSLNLATASLGQLSSSDAAGVTAQALKAFGLESRDAGASVDKMVTSMNLFAVQAKDLPLGLQNSVRGAFALGQSLDETLVSFGLVKNIMPRTESAATAVSMAMERLADKKVQSDLKGLGVAVVDNAGSFRPFLDVVGEMSPKLAAMTEAQRAAFLQSTFGTEAMGGLNAIMGQLTSGVQTQAGETVKGAAAVAYFRREMTGSAGAAEKFANELASDLPGIVRQLKAAGMTFLQMLGEPMAAAIRPAAEAVLSGLRRLGDAVRAVPKDVQVFAARAFMLGAAIMGVAGSMVAGNASLRIFTAGLKAVRATAIVTSGSLLPITAGLALAGAAVVGFKYAVDNNLGGIGDRWRELVADVSLIGKALSQHFKDGFISGAVKDDLQKVENRGVLRFVDKVIHHVRRAQNFMSGLAAGFSRGMAALKPVFAALGDELAKVGIAFRTFEGGEKAFGDAKKSGDALGGGFAKLVGVAAKLAIVGVSVGIVLLRFGEWVGGVVDKLGGLETVVKLVEIALVAMTVRGTANAAIGLAGMATSSYEAIGALRGVAGQAKGVSSVAGAFNNVRGAANGAIGKVEAATAALVALYIAYDQWQSLQKETDVSITGARMKGDPTKADVWGEGWNKLRKDVGDASRVLGFKGDTIGITDAEYERRLGINSGVQLNTGTGKRTTMDVYRTGDGLERVDPMAVSDRYRVGLGGGSPLDAAMAKAAKSTASISVSPGTSSQNIEAMIKALGGVDKATAAMLRESAQMQLEAAQINRDAADRSSRSDLD